MSTDLDFHLAGWPAETTGPRRPRTATYMPPAPVTYPASRLSREIFKVTRNCELVTDFVTQSLKPDSADR